MNSRARFFVVSTSAFLVLLLLVGAHLGKSASTEEGAYRQFKVFTDVLSRVKSEYVEEPDMKSVTLGALNGLLESVDPFASYLNAEQYKQYLKEKDASRGDVGMVLAKRYGYVGVVSALPDSPAAKQGISTGDLIESIKGIATRDMPLAYAEILLKGQPGTDVEISLLRMPDPEPQKVTLTRAVVLMPVLNARMLPEQIGYIQPGSLTAGKAVEISNAARSLEKQGAKGLILDLRNCAMGTPGEGIAVANLFVGSGLLTYLEGQQQPRKDYQAEAAKAVVRLPLVVTTNSGTADGAEIAASALLESKRAEVVGGRTFGDAAVRRAITMEDGGALILSVAKFYSPQGKAIQDTGVIPSVPYVESEPTADLEDEAAETPPRPVTPQAPPKPEDDKLLKKAIEVLTKGPSAEAASTRTEAPIDRNVGQGSGRDNILTPMNVPKQPSK
jgi:carboxyl-terminal processing protease